MTTTRLTRHYTALAAAERYSLLLAAASRQDWGEHTRLLAAAPQIAIRAPDTFPRAMAFREALDWHRMERLELATLLFQAQYMVADATEGIAARMEGVARVLEGLLPGGGPSGWQRQWRQGRPPIEWPGTMPGQLVGHRPR